MSVDIRLRGDLKSNWLVSNPVLSNRETVIETDTNRLKIGNGINHYADLKYCFRENLSAKKTVVRFGDSLTEFDTYNYIGKYTDSDIINCGIGGTMMGKNITPTAYDYLTMYHISEGIRDGVWTNQINAANNIFVATGDDNRATITRMSEIDFDNVDIITCWFGTNDLTGGNDVGVNNDSTALTVKGAMNYIIDNILQTYPHIELIFITPIYRNVLDESCDTWETSNGVKLIDIVNGEIELCEYRHVRCINLFNSIGINKDNILTFLSDGTHPNELGYKRICEKISKEL